MSVHLYDTKGVIHVDNRLYLDAWGWVLKVARATDLAEEQKVPNAKFQVTDALNMDFQDDSFDLVWACESGEHMPDKRKYIEEMTRVLKPGG